MIRLLLVDDHALFRQGLKGLLASAPDLRVVAEAGSYSQALEMLRTTEINVVVADLSMPGRDGLDLISHIKGANPAVAVMVLTIHDESIDVRRAGIGDTADRQRPKLRVPLRFRKPDAQVHARRLGCAAALGPVAP
jgi:CheY-like chemotaxis protein